MKDGTVKLSGLAKDRFLERFVAHEGEIEPAARERLIARAKATFTSLRVRKAAMAAARKQPPAPATKAGPSATPPTTPDPVVPAAGPAQAASAAPPAAFDAYAVRLVPVFQREGRDGLLAQLGGIGEVDHLRLIAKAQQIVLPQELRTGAVAAETVRAAIVEAVARRIADRRAAAG